MRAGFPHDPTQWIALALSVAVVVAAPLLVRPARRRVVFVAAASLAACALSALYVGVYLRGGPRIIDATSYWLEARALSEGWLSFPIDEPVSSTMGRFLVLRDAAFGPRAAVLFPPGYPALLALGFLVGAPLAVGPLLAAAIVVVTYDLAQQVEVSLTSCAAPASAPAPASAISIASIAALLSVVCAALRYHTADTMSHGLSALCFAGALTLFLRAKSTSRPSLAAAAGLLAGWLAATRLASSLALAAALALALALDRALPRRARFRLAAALALGALPGLALLIAHQRAATGAWATSSQMLYYAASDGPPSCFRFGFGEGIGCLGEHGDFVRANLPEGFGALAATKTTLRRLHMHLVDVANIEPLAFLVPMGAILSRRAPVIRLLAAAIALQIAAYVPFYFDGNYPGGGARFFADVLPLEHVLVAVAAAAIARRAARPASAHRLAAAVVATALAGFSVRAGFDHAHLRDREGGLPMFEPERLTGAGITRGLVFVDTDHGFGIAYDPAASAPPPRDAPASPRGLVQIARYRGDAIDLFAWEARGRPDAYRYRYRFPADDGERAAVSIEPLSFDRAAPLRIQGESLWPARSQDRAWALPEHAGGTCASGDRWLAIHARSGEEGSALLTLPARWLRGRTIAPRVGVGVDIAADDTQSAHTAGPRPLLGEIVLFVDGAEARRWPIPFPSSSALIACETLAAELIPPAARTVELALSRARQHSPNPSKSNVYPLPHGPILALDSIAIGGGENH